MAGIVLQSKAQRFLILLHLLWLVTWIQISELGNKQTTTLVFENKEFNLKTQT